MKKIIIITVAIALFLLVGFVAFSYYIGHKFKTGELIRWNDKIYTQKQIEEIFPPQYVNAPAQNTPEEVYTKFREAILKDDVEEALQYIAEKNKERYAKNFSKVEVLKKYKEMPEVNKIKKIELESYNNYFTYRFELNNKKYDVNFYKDEKGYWFIESI